MVYMYIVSVAAASFAFFLLELAQILNYSFFVTPFCKHVQLGEHQVQQYNLWRRF